MHVRIWMCCLSALVATAYGNDHKYQDLKCWKNRKPSQLVNLERSGGLGIRNYRKRPDAVNKCFTVAKAAGYDFFALGNKGQCWGGNGESYTTYGKARSCPDDGKGKAGVINVYHISTVKEQDYTDYDYHYDYDDTTTIAPTRPPTTIPPTRHPTTIAPTRPPTTIPPTRPPTTTPPTGPPTTIPPTRPPTTIPPTRPPTTIPPTRPPTTRPPTRPTTVAPTVQADSIPCGDATCSQSTQYCSTKWFQKPECKDKGQLGSRCRDDGECVSNNCKFIWTELSRSCANKDQVPQPIPDKARPNNKGQIPCGRNLCNGKEEYCFSGRQRGRFTAQCLPREKKGSRCVGDEQCASDSCVFRWYRYRCQ